MTRAHSFPTLVAFLAGMPGFIAPVMPARAAALHGGDFVMVTWWSDFPCCRVLSLDPTTLAVSEITSDGLIADPQDIAVSHQGEILVTVPNVGLIRVDPATGSQSILTTMTSLGGGTIAGVCVGSGGEIYATLRGPARVVQLDGDGSLDRVISTGGLLTYPAGLTLSTDGALFVCETIPTGYPPGGGLIRVDLGSGAQTLFASGDPLNGPFDVTLAPDGWLWSIQHNVQLHEIPGPLVRTRVTDGFSEIVPTDQGGGSVNGVTIRTDGRTLIADCVAIHGSCSIPDTKFYPDGLEGPRARVTGPLAFVPDMVTLDRKTSWGQLKLIYR